MVAPIQGTVGKTSTDSATVDYLTELNNFYKKPENEGIKSQFVAPDGSSYDITDASYLSKIQSNVTTGKLDIPASKSVDSNADMSLDSKSKKSDNNDSEYAKNKKSGADKGQNEISNTQNAGNAAGSAQSQAEGAQQGKGTVEGVNTKPEEVANTSGPAVQQQQTEEQNAAKQTVESQKKLKEENEKGKQERAKGDAGTAKINAGFKSAMSQLNSKIEAKKSSQESQAASAPEMSDNAETQSGSKMGFEGKLMTVGGSVSGGESSTDAAWEKTMEGPKNQIAQNFQKQEATLQNVKAAGEKAAEGFNKQAEATDVAAGQKLTDAQGQTWKAGGEFAIATVSAVDGVVGLTSGTASVATATTDTATGVPLATNPVTAPTGLALIAKAVIGFVKSVFSFAKGALKFVSAATSALSGAMSLKTAKGLRNEKASLNSQADAQRGQGVTARRKAVADTNKANAQTLAATSQVNAMMSSLGNSALPSITVENKEQFEVVKKERYDQIMAHEQEHSAVIGGTPVITTDSNGVAIAGYVQIDVPSVNESDLEGTIQKAQKVIDAALAPSDPSSQDQNVASKAKSVLEKAQDLLEERANNAKDSKEDSKEQKKEEPKQEVKDELKK